jgi:hypothetical protein
MGMSILLRLMIRTETLGMVPRGATLAKFGAQFAAKFAARFGQSGGRAG